MKGVWYRPAKIIKEEDWVNCVPENITLGNKVYNEYTRQTVTGTMPVGIATYASGMVGKDGSYNRVFRGHCNQITETLFFAQDGYFLPNYYNRTVNSEMIWEPSCYVSGAEKIGNINRYPMYKVQAYQQITPDSRYSNNRYGGMFYRPGVGQAGLSPGGIKKGVVINGIRGSAAPAYPIGAMGVYSSGSNWPQIRYNNEAAFVPDFSAGPSAKHIRFGLSIALPQPLTVSFIVHSTLTTFPEPVLSQGSLHTDRAFNGSYGIYHFELSTSEWTYVTWTVSKAAYTYVEVYADRMTASAFDK